MCSVTMFKFIISRFVYKIVMHLMIFKNMFTYDYFVN